MTGLCISLPKFLYGTWELNNIGNARPDNIFEVWSLDPCIEK
jgi:hypothetical protein